MFGWEFPPHNSGGLGTACEGLTRALAGLGTEVIFVLPKRVAVSSDCCELRFAEIENVDIRSIPGLLQPYLTSADYARLRRETGNALYGLSLVEEVKLYAGRAVELAKTEHFDVIHAHDWLAYPAGIAAKQASGKPLIAHVHATEFDRVGGLSVNQEVYKIEKEGLAAADKIIAVSQRTKDMVVQHYGVPANKVEVVHNGIDAATITNTTASDLAKLKQLGNKIVLFVGRITFQKGPDYFVQMAKRVLEYCPDTYFVVAGSGEMLPQIIDQAAKLGIVKRFLFAGFVRGAELDAVYKVADIYVLPSVSEPFGITPLESLVNGTPVLVSKQSGVAEVLSHALKADFWDIDEMANQIIAVLCYPTLRQTLAEYGKGEAHNITWTKAATKCLNLYKSFI
jgi:glycosyltransferase involved in cell wall biosynthesis